MKRRRIASIATRLSLGAGLVLALSGPTTAAAQVDGPSTFAVCDGRFATIVSGAAVINGTPGDDVIVASGVGNNTIFAGDGNDRICAGPGNDVVYGGRGNDRAFGGTGNDYLFGESGSDTLYGQDGDDKLHGHDGNDVLYGGTGRDLLVGWAGSDWHNGEDQDDRIDAVKNDNGLPDTALGSNGNDTILVNDGIANDVGNGGAGWDSCWGDAGELVNCP